MSYAGRMLNGVHLVNFGNHRDTKIYFGPITALVGANGSGKTTVMRALELVQYEDWGPAHRVRHGCEFPLVSAAWPDAKESKTLELGISNKGGTLTAYTRKKPSSDESPRWIPDPLDIAIDRESSWDVLPPGRVFEWDSWDLRHGYGPKLPDWNCRYFKTNAWSLQRPSYAEAYVPRLDESGSNLAAVLSYLMTADPDRFEQIIKAFRKVVPLVKRVRARPVSIERVEKQTVTVNKVERVYEETKEVPGQELIFDMVSGTGLSASLISEGTLVTLAILTLVYGDDEADMIMLDDVELGLHPKAQRDLMRQLKAIQQTNPKLQILVSTHSPYVVDELAPEDVWLFTTDKEGCALSARLSEHPDAKRALEVLSTGEFWSAEGEEWVAARADEKAREAPESVVREEE